MLESKSSVSRKIWEMTRPSNFTLQEMVSENGKDYIIYTDHELVESVETRTRVTIADEQVPSYAAAAPIHT